MAPPNPTPCGGVRSNLPTWGYPMNCAGLVRFLLVLSFVVPAAAQHITIFGAGGDRSSIGGGVSHQLSNGVYVGWAVLTSRDETVQDPDLRRQTNVELDLGYGKARGSVKLAVFGIVGIRRASKCIDPRPETCEPSFLWLDPDGLPVYTGSSGAREWRSGFNYGIGSAVTVAGHTGVSFGVRATNQYLAGFAGITFNWGH